jgi:dTDP-4-dehydrorhamnose reductase
MSLLITGASGQLGAYLLRKSKCGAQAVAAWSGSRTGELEGVRLRPVDLADPDAVAAAFREARPTAVIHAGAVSAVSACFRDPEYAHRVNTKGSAVLAELADRAGVRLVLVSTDLVFDGTRGGYREDDAPAPLSIYGRTKAAAEQAVLAFPRHAVVRLSLLFGPSLCGRPSFFDDQLAALRRGTPCRLFEDEWRTPLDLVTAARGLLAVAGSDVTGLLHLGGPERLSRWEMGLRLASFLGTDSSALVPVTRDSARAPEPRPRDTSLDSSRWRELFPDQPRPSWEEALRQMNVR